MDPAQNTNTNPVSPEVIPSTAPVNTVQTDQTPSIPPPNIPIAVTVTPSSQKKKFPVLILLLIVILIGLAGSFLFFNISSIKKQLSGAPVPTTTPVIPPTLVPTVFSNPFSTPSGQVTNPFASPSASTENPFGKYENPFVSSSPSGTTDQPYKNPFGN